jgi:hypothetical protein
MSPAHDPHLKPDVPVLKDSGERRQFTTGAVRDRAVGKGRFDLIPSQAMFRYARHMEAGAIKYSPRNWEMGMEHGVYIDAALRHIEKYKDGWDDEDHLAAALWNIASLMHMQVEHPELNDLPRWDGRRSKWIMERPADA